MIVILSSYIYFFQIHFSPTQGKVRENPTSHSITLGYNKKIEQTKETSESSKINHLMSHDVSGIEVADGAS